MKIMVGKRSKLNRIRNEVEEIGNIIGKNGFYFVSKNLLKKAINKLVNDDLEEVSKLINLAKALALKEKEIRQKLNEVKSLIDKKLPGSDPKEAIEFYQKAMKFLKKGEYEEAEKMTEKAKNSAKPSPEFLLQKARKYHSSAIKNFKEDRFEKAVQLWKKSKNEFEKAKEIAMERNDPDMLKNIDDSISKIDRCIEEAQISNDNRRMVSIIEEVDKKIEEAEKIAKKGAYEDSISLIEEAKKEANEARKIAKKRKFKDINLIEKRIEDIDERIKFYKLEKGRWLLNKSLAKIEKNPQESEKELYSIMKYLKSLDFENESLRRVLENCKKAIVHSKIKQAENRMKEAEELYKKEKFYDAREIYRGVYNYLLKVVEETGRLEVISEIDDVRKLIRVCNENIESCNSQLFKFPDAPKRKIIEVSDYRKKPIPMDIQPLFVDKRIEKLAKEYEILEKIGKGGFADVYKAKYKNEDKIVALKVPVKLTKSGEKIFFEEFSNWKQLSHRNIVKLIEPRLQPIPHLVIEYIDGMSLDELLANEGRIDIKTACRIAFDIARALEYAHSKLIVHGDLKPANVLITGLKEAKITDFGIAKTITSTSGIKGLTLLYAAPEQLDEKCDERTDIYQLGLIFYQSDHDLFQMKILHLNLFYL